MQALNRLLRKEWVSRLIDGLLPVFATLAALGVGAIILLFLKVNPIEAYQALWEGAFGSPNAFAETLVKATPLLLVAIGRLWRTALKNHPEVIVGVSLSSIKKRISFRLG